MTTEVTNSNDALKGLVLYGDASQSIGLGIASNTLQVWEVKNNKKAIVHQETVNSKKPLQLKMQVEKGYLCRFFWRNDTNAWKEVKTQAAVYNADFLPPWDRSPRPGLMHQGSESGAFNYFTILYL